ncbi:hypothetical protein GGF31_001449 [Allomyces arbusculus]|nr:hypothetical protein GGF31_001449 [Allomyces arbusculus]
MASAVAAAQYACGWPATSGDVPLAMPVPRHAGDAANADADPLSRELTPLASTASVSTASRSPSPPPTPVHVAFDSTAAAAAIAASARVPSPRTGDPGVASAAGGAPAAITDAAALTDWATAADTLGSLLAAAAAMGHGHAPIDGMDWTAAFPTDLAAANDAYAMPAAAAAAGAAPVPTGSDVLLGDLFLPSLPFLFAPSDQQIVMAPDGTFAFAPLPGAPTPSTAAAMATLAPTSVAWVPGPTYTTPAASWGDPGFPGAWIDPAVFSAEPYRASPAPPPPVPTTTRAGSTLPRAPVLPPPISQSLQQSAQYTSGAPLDDAALLGQLDALLAQQGGVPTLHLPPSQPPQRTSPLAANGGRRRPSTASRLSAISGAWSASDSALASRAASPASRARASTALPVVASPASLGDWAAQRSPRTASVRHAAAGHGATPMSPLALMARGLDLGGTVTTSASASAGTSTRGGSGNSSLDAVHAAAAAAAGMLAPPGGMPFFAPPPAPVHADTSMAMDVDMDAAPHPPPPAAFDAYVPHWDPAATAPPMDLPAATHGMALDWARAALVVAATPPPPFLAMTSVPEAAPPPPPPATTAPVHATPAPATAAAAAAPRARAKPNKIPRPENSFFLYRRAVYPAVVKANPHVSNPDMSKIISEMWRSELPEVREHYKHLAELAKKEHARKYPDYKYQPKRTKRDAKAGTTSGSATASTTGSIGRAAAGKRASRASTITLASATAALDVSDTPTAFAGGPDATDASDVASVLDTSRAASVISFAPAHDATWSRAASAVPPPAPALASASAPAPPVDAMDWTATPAPLPDPPSAHGVFGAPPLPPPPPPGSRALASAAAVAAAAGGWPYPAPLSPNAAPPPPPAPAPSAPAPAALDPASQAWVNEFVRVMGDPAALAAALSGRNAATVAAATAAAQAVLSSYGRRNDPPPPPMATTPTHATWARAQAQAQAQAQQASEYAASIASIASIASGGGGWTAGSPAVGGGAGHSGWMGTSPAVPGPGTGHGWPTSPAVPGSGAWSTRAYSPMPAPLLSQADARSMRTDEGGGGGSVAGGASWHETGRGGARPPWG